MRDEETFVVIPHYGDGAMLDQCLSAVRQNQGIAESNIIVVDNNADNRMFTRGVNVGIADALATGAGYVWVLNNDTIPAPDYLENSIARFGLSPRCGLVGGKNLRTDDPDHIFWGGSGQAFPSGKHKMGRVSSGDLALPTVEPWATFSSVVVDAAMFALIGLLDEQFLMIASDSDFCFRLRLAGYQVWYEPNAVISHHLGASSTGKTQHTPEMLKILQTDQKRFFRKWSAVTGCTHRNALDAAINRYIDFPSLR